MKIVFSFLIVSCVILFSCQAGIDDILPPQAQAENDSVYISKLTELDTLLPPGLDTIQNATFDYDASKRISHIFFAEYGGQGPDLTDDYYYFYNGNDTLPYKIAHQSGSVANGPFGFDTTFLFYTGGVLIKDSIIEAASDQVYQRTTVSLFTKIADGHYRVDTRLMDGGEVYTSYTNSHFTLVGGNAVSLKDTTVSEGGNDAISIEQSDYDNHPNPLKRVAAHYPTASAHYGLLNEISANNRIRWQGLFKYEGSFEENYLEVYEFRYRADGYPVARISKGGNAELSLKTIYSYKKL